MDELNYAKYLPGPDCGLGSEATINQVVDRMAIEEIIRRYGQALDVGDIPMLLSCFSADIHLEYVGGKYVMDGIDEARDFFTNRPSAHALGFTRLEGSTHIFCNTRIELREKSARSTTFAVAFLTGIVNGKSALVIRGLRYVDDFVRQPKSWHISDRRHFVDWNHHAA